MSVSPEAPAADLLRWLETQIGQGDEGRLGSGYQAVVHRYVGPHGDVAVKSPHERWPLGYLSRRALRHEHGIYARLAGVPGVPRSYGMLGGKHLVLEHIEGPSLRAHESQLADRERFFAQLLETIDAMHAAGVAHGDLKRKDNVIVGPGERPYVIDFGVAFLARERNAPRGVLFGLIAQMDYNAWVKLKYGRKRGPLSPAEAARYRPLVIERIARVIRVAWQTLTLREPRKRRRERRRS